MDLLALRGVAAADGPGRRHADQHRGALIVIATSPARLCYSGRLLVRPSPGRVGFPDALRLLHGFGIDLLVDLAALAGHHDLGADLQPALAELAHVRRDAQAAELHP